MKNELIPCTPELERLKYFLRALSRMKKNYAVSRVRVAKYYEGLPPYTEEELMNTPWTGLAG